MKKLSLADKDCMVWVEQESSIQMKAVTSHGDPIELTDEEVKSLVDFLTTYLEECSD